MIDIAVDDLGVTTRDGVCLLDGVTLTAPAGSILGILGPNGAGKSTLLRCLYGALRPSRGRVLLGGTDAARLSDRARARLLAGVPQDSPAEFPLAVRTVVETGRACHARGLFGGDPDGAAAITTALARLGLDHLADRPFTTLSGGERKRALIARAVAQQPEALVLDEPINHLDIRHQLELMGLLRRLGVTVMVALHAFDLAARFCDRVAVLAGGRLVAIGPPQNVLTAPLIRSVFDVDAVVDRAADGALRIHTRVPPPPAVAAVDDPAPSRRHGLS